MKSDNTRKSLNQLPLLNKDMKRMLRLWAWRDEDFREALIADPKGVIPQIFPHCFPDGKIADNLTIKLIDEDLFTRHIVLPALADEVTTLEISEKGQVELLANLGTFDRKRPRDNDQTKQSNDVIGTSYGTFDPFLIFYL